MSKTFLFQAIQFSQTVQFSINMQFDFIWPIDRTLSDATTPGQSGPGSDGNEEVLHIPQSSSITKTSLWDCLVSYPRYLLPLCRDAVGVFNSPSLQGNLYAMRHSLIFEPQKYTHTKPQSHYIHFIQITSGSHLFCWWLRMSQYSYNTYHIVKT